MHKKLFLYIALTVLILSIVAGAGIFFGANPYASIGAGLLIALVFALVFARSFVADVFSMEKRLETVIAENAKAEGLRREFVANVTHELRTPLTSISGYAETLQGDAGKDEKLRHHFLDIITIEAARLDRLIEDVLLLSDIENSTDIHEGFLDEDIDVRACIGEVIEALSPVANKNRVEISFYIPYEIHIGGEIDRFKQLMMNLIVNAIKYSWNGEEELKTVEDAAIKQVWVRAKRENDAVIITIRDEGIGIAQSDIPRLFERFYRVDRSRSREAGGTGLGLAIVKHIVMLFEAKITVDSEVGKGTMFMLEFRG